MWNITEYFLPEHDLRCLGYHPWWVDELSSTGVRECYYLNGEWVSSDWNVKEGLHEEDHDITPERWMPMPEV